jgi:hypothetical protein
VGRGPPGSSNRRVRVAVSKPRPVDERVVAVVAEPQPARARDREQRGEEGDREDGLAKRHCVLTGRGSEVEWCWAGGGVCSGNGREG